MFEHHCLFALQVLLIAILLSILHHYLHPYIHVMAHALALWVVMVKQFFARLIFIFANASDGSSAYSFRRQMLFLLAAIGIN